MSFEVFTEGCSNLPGGLLEILNIHVVECAYSLNGREYTYKGDIASFNSHAYYEALRKGGRVTTSLVNMQSFVDAFEPYVKEGSDIIHVTLSAGISGTYQAAFMASRYLEEQYPGRTVRIIDSMGAGLGTGILTCRAADMRNEGLEVNEAGDRLDEEVKNLCEYFIVDDLRFLARTGRVSGAAAIAGNMLHIMPMLRGDETGHIVASGKYRGRKKAMEAILDVYKNKVKDPRSQRIAITHGDCPEEAEKLKQAVLEIARPKELYVCAHEPFTGAHVGPGMLALFFFGEGR